MSDTRATVQGLRAAIDRSGYYPDLVADAVESMLADEPALSYVVHHEATFDVEMEVHRHITVLVLSPTRLLVCHTDDHPPTDDVPRPHATTTSESVALSRVRSVAVTRVVSEPASYVPGAPPSEVVLAIGWGAISRVDIEPATCGDETCEADHGYTGSVTADDLSLRVSAAADGVDSVGRALDFARSLTEATTRGGA
ncbi:MAG: DUF5998 family protein [Streptosporangiaceae bacterium]